MTTQRICGACGYLGEAVDKNKGNGWIEFILWIFFFIPGLIYSIWRRSGKPSLCAKCGQSSLIPADSPMGKRLLNDTNQQVVEEAPKKFNKRPYILVAVLVVLYLIVMLMVSGK